MFARTLGRVGRTLIAAGVLVFLFLAYLLWGTNLQTEAAQEKLDKEYAQEVAEAKAKLATTTTTTTLPGAVPVSAEGIAVPLPAPRKGDIVGRISIPKIGLRPKVVVEDALDEEELKRGPAHYVGTPLPGQKGNVGIAGHRTTYGSPFHDINELTNGDKIVVSTTYGEFTYSVVDKKIVDPSDTSVLEDHGQAMLTLTACHPIWSAEQRIIIIAKLEGATVGKLEGQDEIAKKALAELPGDGPASEKAGLSINAAHPPKTQMLFWGLVCAGIWLVAWALARFVLKPRVKRPLNWIPYVIGFPLFMLSLYVFFEHFVRQLPSNF